MKPKTVFLFFNFLILYAGRQLHAQEFYGPWEIPDSSVHYVFAETAYIRNSPSVSANSLLDSLSTGDEVFVIRRTEKSLYLKGINAPWVDVSYKKDGSTKRGFIWGGLLSFQPQKQGNTKFIYGIERRVTKDTIFNGEKNTSNYFLVSLKIFENGKLFAKTDFYTHADESSSYVYTDIFSSKGLKNVRCVPAVSFGGEACGIPSLTYAHLWTGRELYNLPVLMSVADADVYYHVEEYIFPKDKGGKHNQLIWTMEEGEADETKVDKDGSPIMHKKKDRKVYTWDGEKLSQH